MAKKDLTGKKVAILVDEGFEQVELIKPRKALDRLGAQTQVVSPQEGEVRGWNVKRWGKSVAVDVPLHSADPSAFDALLLPGGVMNPDKLRMNPKAGGNWVDEEVVTDRGIVTSRKPDDIRAFNKKMIEEFAEGERASRERDVA